MAKLPVPNVVVLSLSLLLLAFVALPAAGARAVAVGPRRLLAEIPEGGAGVEVEGGKAGGAAEARDYPANSPTPTDHGVSVMSRSRWQSP